MDSPRRFAALDIGSNTVRLLIAERQEGEAIQPLRRERKVTRLGGNFSLSGYLHPGAMDRTLEAVRQFAEILKKEGVERIFAVATGVVREAKNGRDFLAQIRKETGISPGLITGEEEARTMLRGVLWGVPPGIPVRMVVDIGGWSTEILWIEGGKVWRSVSAPLGAVSLCEGFLKSDPPTAREIELLDLHLRDAGEEFFGDFLDSGWGPGARYPLVGTAGTITTLAALDLELRDYDPAKVTGHQISRAGIEGLFARLSLLPTRERRLVPGLEKGREDLILSGIRVVLSLMKFFGFEKLLIVDSGLLEGVLLEGISKDKGKFVTV